MMAKTEIQLTLKNNQAIFLVANCEIFEAFLLLLFRFADLNVFIQ